MSKPPAPSDPAEYVHADHAGKRRNGAWMVALAVVLAVLTVTVLLINRAYERASRAEDNAREASAALAQALVTQQDQFIRCVDKKAATTPSCAEPVTDDPEQVVQGAVGPAGAQGIPGAAGSIGAAGTTGRPGRTGATGATGQNGAPGVAGATGEPGDDGQDGTGNTGATGPQGPPGPAGPAGADGQNGADGAPGPAGAVGETGPTGAQGPPGPTCAEGFHPEDRILITTVAPLGEPAQVCVPDAP